MMWTLNFLTEVQIWMTEIQIISQIWMTPSSKWNDKSAKLTGKTYSRGYAAILNVQMAAIISVYFHISLLVSTIKH